MDPDSIPELDFFHSVCASEQWTPNDWNLKRKQFTDPLHKRVWDYINDYVRTGDKPPAWSDLCSKYPRLADETSFAIPIALAVERLHEALYFDAARRILMRTAAAIDSGELEAHAAAVAEQHALTTEWEAHQNNIGNTSGDISVTDEAFFTSNYAQPLWKPSCPMLADALDGGFRPGTMNIVAADAGVGKSMWLLARAVEAAEQNLNVLFVSLEMPRSECSQRINNIVAGRNTKYMNPAETHKIVQVWSQEHEGDVKLRDDTQYDPSPANIRRALAEYDLVCVDYGGLMVSNDGVSHSDSHNVAEEIVLGLLGSVRRFDGESDSHRAVLLVAAQLSKSAKPIRKFADCGFNVPYAAGTYAWGRSVHCFITVHSQGLPSDLRVNAVEKHRSYRKSKPWFTRMDPGNGDFSHISDEQAREEIDNAQASDYEY